MIVMIMIYLFLISKTRHEISLFNPKLKVAAKAIR